MVYQQSLTPDTELIGDFRILGLLGSGGFANTYLAMDLTLGREVAIKEFFPSELAIRADSKSVSVKSAAHSSQFEWARGRFVREAKTLAKFRHPSVVRVFRVFNANNTAYMVLEFVHGSNMETWLKKLQRPPTQDDFDILLPPLLDALEVVHQAGILHRDVKPANIYIREGDNTPVLLDFGAAKYATAADNAGTTAAIVSKGYSPNEAYATDAKLQGPWTDIYGLAATAYRALTGSAPPESTSRILNDECILTSQRAELVEHYRPEFLAAIDGALAVIPKDRPQSIGQWRKEMFPNFVDSRPSRSPSGSVLSDPEWHPLSDTPSDVDTIYSQSLGKSGSGTSPSPSGGSQGSGQISSSAPGNQTPRQPSEAQISSRSQPGSISGPSPSAAAIDAGVGASPSLATPSAASGDQRKSSAGPISALTKTVLHTANSVGSEASRSFYLGLFLFAAGGIALGSHLITSPSEPEPQSTAPGSGFEQVAALNQPSADELARKAAEAEAARKAEEDRKAEAVRKAEAARKAEEEQRAADRAAAEEKRRLEESATQARLEREAAQKAREAEQQRRAEQETAAQAERRKQQEERDRLAREEEQKKRQAAEELRLAEQRAAAAAERRRQEQEERDRLAREAAEKERQAAEERRLAEQRAAAAAERRRKEREESARLAREAAERDRLAREERRLAREKAAAEKRRQEREERDRIAREEAEKRRLAEQQAADELAREQAELEAAAIAHNSEFQVAALQQAATIPDADQRHGYITRMQTLLKERSCYEGSVNGSLEDTQSALEKLEKNKKIKAPPIRLASATRGEYEDWFSWLRPLEGSLCPAPEVKKEKPKLKWRPVPKKKKTIKKPKPPQTKLKKRPTTKKKKVIRKKKRVIQKKKKRPVKPKSRPRKKRASSSSSSSPRGNSLLRGGR